MFKIKLLILSLVSFIFISCTNSENKNYEMKYSLGYITGEYDALVLKNYLKNYLKSFNLYDENSLFEIRSSISHSSEVYITNIDNDDLVYSKADLKHPGIIVSNNKRNHKKNMLTNKRNY